MPTATRTRHTHNARAGWPQLAMITRQYQAEMNRRFGRIKALIIESIVTNDCFRLTNKPSVLSTLAAAALPFEFTDNPAKVAAFMEWLRAAQDDHILEVTERVGRRVVAHSEWQNIYVRRSYEKGIVWAQHKLKEQGIDVPEEELRAIFNKPIHADALGMLYTRNFTELNGINEAMDQKISRELIDGLAQGKNPREIARLINKNVDNVGRTRARTLARTEVNRTQNEASLNRYQDYGVEKVEIMVGAGPCPGEVCDAIAGVYKIEDARGLLPVHPNCTCALAPVVGVPKEATTLAEARRWALDHDLAKEVNYGKLSLEVANQLNRSVYAAQQIYPRLRESMKYMGSMQSKHRYFHIPGKIDPAVRAMAAPKKFADAGITLNEKFFSDAILVRTEEALTSEVLSGWCAKGAGSIEGVINHEIGHLLDGVAGFTTQRGKAMYGLWGKASVANNLSRYGATSTGEMVAEAWAEYIMTDKPRMIAKLIGRGIEKALGVKFK